MNETKRRRIFGQLFANEAQGELMVLEGFEIPEGLANEAGYNGEGGWVMLAPYGDHQHSQGVQKFRREDALAIIEDFKSFANIGVRTLGIPFYVGHPDHPAFEAKYTDRSAYGRIKSLEARDGGLFGNVKWNDKGKHLIASEAYHGHSVNWRMIRETNGGAYRPRSLKSVGFTNDPNIPVNPILSANEKLLMNKTLLQILGLPENATQTQLDAALTLAANELQTFNCTLVALLANHKKAQTDLQAANEKVTTIATLEADKVTLANEKAALATEKATLAGQVTALTTERDTAKTAFANERKELVKLHLDNAITAKKITIADRAQWETDFANEATFSATLEKLNKLGTSALPGRDKSRIDGGNRVAVIQQQQDRSAKVIELVNERMEKKGDDYDAAWAAVQREHPALFQAMHQPEHNKK